MDACISNNFIFIIFMIVKNSHKVERSEKELTDSIRRFIYSEMASFHFLSGVKLILFVSRIPSEQYGNEAYT